jgi:2-polyprenyl-6-methoxyphenol hydroxylase-like FAD-dependent oxidoreductase
MERRREKILISGAGIAGAFLANLLNRVGFRTVVVEKAMQLRTGGQNVDIHGAGRLIVERMGFLDTIKSFHTTERGLRMVDSDGRTLKVFPQDTEKDEALTKELEILRSDLAKVFYQSSHLETEYRFGLTIQAQTEFDAGISVKFSDGKTEEFDLVVSAEGVGSPTRNQVMKGFFEKVYLGAWMGFFRIPKTSTDDEWAEAYMRKGGPGLMIRPSSDDSRGVLLSFKSDDGSFNYRTISEQKQIIRDYLKDGGWQCERVLANLDWDDDLYLGPLIQIKASQWSKGRFVLLGDAGYSPSVLTGRGTTLAITGAYVLAGELANTDKLHIALKAYEAKLKVFANACQYLPPEYLNYLDFDENTDKTVETPASFVLKEPYFELPNYPALLCDRSKSC